MSAAAGPVPPPWLPAQAPAPGPARVGRRVGPTGFSEPEPWPDDGGRRREPVLDHDYHPPLVVRRVGWQRCMRCRQTFWSEDVVRLRLCGGEGGCRADEDRFASGLTGGTYSQSRRDGG